MTKTRLNLRKRNSKQPEPKDRKNRKSISQKMALWQFYRGLNGETPTKQTIKDLAEDLKLKVSQVYKWFWDMNRKVDNCTEENPDTVPTVKGLTPEICAQAFPNLPNLENIEPDEFELLANEVDIDVEKLAQEMINLPSPTNARQIVKRVRRVVKPSTDIEPLPVTRSLSRKSSSERPVASVTSRMTSKKPLTRHASLKGGAAATPDPPTKPLIQLSAFQQVKPGSHE